MLYPILRCWRQLYPIIYGLRKKKTRRFTSSARIGLEELESRLAPASVSFAVIGDYGQAGTPESQVASLVSGWNPNLILTVGDNNYPTGAASTIDANVGQYYHSYISPYVGSYGAGATTNRFFPTLGHADWGYTYPDPTGDQPYLNYFTLPGNERYYTFTQGPVQFFALDSDGNEPDGISSTSPQAQWLQAQLAASTATYKIVYMHDPPYSSSSGFANPPGRWPYQAWGATAVIAGHAHSYERLAEDNNFPYFVDGLGGDNEISTFDAIDPGSQVRYNANYGAMLVTADPTRIQFQFITIAGTVIDTYTISAGPPPFSKFALGVVGGNTVVAGNPFVVTAQATDAVGNPVSSPLTSITATASPTDPQGNFPSSAPVSGSGFAVFVGDLQTAGSYTLTIDGFTVGVVVTPASPDYLTLTAPPPPFTATTGSAFSVTVKAFDEFGNPATGYTGTVSIASTDPAMTVVPNYTFLPSDNGVHTFSVTLNTSTLAPGNPGTTIFARDIAANAPPISGFSAPIAVRGLVVPAGGFQSTANGFMVTFNKQITVADLTEYGFNTTTVPDVTLVGAPLPGMTNPLTIPGTLYIDPTTPNTIVFKATAAFLEYVNLNLGNGGNGDKDSVALPDDTYTVTLTSGTGSNGFVDALNTHLDGLGNGGTANYTTTFATTYQDDAHANASPAEVLGIPDFARGPDSSSVITVPNNKSAPGIPITLYNVPAAGVTDAAFTLTYNPQLFVPTAGGTGDAPAGSTFTMGPIVNIDSTHSSVAFTYHNGTAQSGTVVLGDVLARVPVSASAIYKTTELLALSNITVSGGATVQAASGIHVDAYLGDVHVTGAPAIDASDALDEETFIANKYTGFSAYPLLDPVIVGNVAGASQIVINGSSVTNLFSKSVPRPVPLVPSIPASPLVQYTFQTDTTSAGTQPISASFWVPLAVVQSGTFSASDITEINITVGGDVAIWTQGATGVLNQSSGTVTGTATSGFPTGGSIEIKLVVPPDPYLNEVAFDQFAITPNTDAAQGQESFASGGSVDSGLGHWSAQGFSRRIVGA